MRGDSNANCSSIVAIYIVVANLKESKKDNDDEVTVGVYSGSSVEIKTVTSSDTNY